MGRRRLRDSFLTKPRNSGGHWRPRRLRARAVVVAVGAVAVSIAIACSSAITVLHTDVGPDAADRDAQSSSIDANPVDGEAPDPPRPAGLPEGWVLERTLNKQCQFYVPQTKDLVPPPLEWQQCPTSATPSGVDCRSLPAEPAFGTEDTASVTADGTALLSVVRGAPAPLTGRHWLIAPADGPVRTAIFIPSGSPCGLGWPSLFHDRYVIGAGSPQVAVGIFAGSVDEVSPRLAIHLASSEVNDVAYAAPLWILDLGDGFSLKRRSWTDGTALPVLWSASQDHGLDQGSFVFTEDAMFWSADNLDYHKVNIYTEDGGVRDFLTAGLVVDHGYDDLGTDGKSLVWIEARGRSTGDTTPFATYDVMTSPYAADPTKLTPRRLRSEEGPALGVDPFVVGCGFAARENGHHLRIVRLSDGYSWLLDERTSPWFWSRPFAITCTELFTRAAMANENGARLVRVRLDSLGPGIPPD